MSKIESFAYTCLPALLILCFSEVAVYLAEGQLMLTMGLLGLFYCILVWWLYQYTQDKISMKIREGFQYLYPPVDIDKFLHPKKKKKDEEEDEEDDEEEEEQVNPDSLIPDDAPL